MARDIFDVFEDKMPSVNSTSDDSIQAVYECEKHYMDLIRHYQDEIEFIENMLRDYRREQTEFFAKELPEISRVLDKEHIDQRTKDIWLKRLEENMSRSFSISEKLITHYTTKKIDEFKTVVNDKLRGL